MPPRPHQHVQRLRQRLHHGQRGDRQGLLRGRPKRVVGPAGERREAQHEPVRRAGGVVVLAEELVRVRVPDGQRAGRREDVRLAHPPATVAQQEALDDAPRERRGEVHVCDRDRRPEARHREPVRHAAAKGDVAALRVVVEHSVEGERARPGPELGGAAGVPRAVQVCVEELQELDGVGAGVAVHLPVALRTVVGPAIAAVELVQVGEVGVEAGLVVVGAVAEERQVGEDAEPEPVGVGHLAVVDAAEPEADVGFFRGAQRIPEGGAGDGEGEAERAHLDHALVNVTVVAPEVGVLGVGAVAEAVNPAVGVVEGAAAGKEGGEAP